MRKPTLELGILEDLYFGDVNLQDRYTFKNNPISDRALIGMDRKEKELKSRLLSSEPMEEEKAQLLIDEFIEAYDQILGEDNMHNHLNDVRFGARLMLDILS